MAAAPKEKQKKVMERASVMFGRPTSRNYEALKKQAKQKGDGGMCACFDGCFGAFLGFPTTKEEPNNHHYGDPKPLEPILPCTPWAELSADRRAQIKFVEVFSASKEGSSVWINQDATAACAPPGNGEAEGDEAAGTTCDGSLIFCVFDGHGKSGHEVARIAAVRLPAHLAAVSGGPLAAPKKALEDAFRKTDNDIFYAMGREVEYSGTTGVAVIFDPAKRVLHVGNVGDSRAVLGQYSPDGRSPQWDALALTADLKPDLPEERERIELSGGTVCALRGDNGEEVGPARVWDSAAREKPGLAVSRSLGDGASRLLGVIAEPVVTVRQLHPNDRFLLIATDGLWDSLGNEQAVRIAAKYLERDLPQVAVKALVEAVRREEGGSLVDDTTIVLVVF